MVSTPNFSRVDITKSAFSSSPTAPTPKVETPSLAQSITVPPAVPATVNLNSSI